MAQSVWLLVMFDLPVKSREQRRLATQYRNMLLDFGFNQVQYSVYSKYFINATGVRKILSPLKSSIPSEGEVRAIKITDDQWSTTFRWLGPKDVPMEVKPSQLALFD